MHKVVQYFVKTINWSLKEISIDFITTCVCVRARACIGAQFKNILCGLGFEGGRGRGDVGRREVKSDRGGKGRGFGRGERPPREAPKYEEPKSPVSDCTVVL